MDDAVSLLVCQSYEQFVQLWDWMIDSPDNDVASGENRTKVTEDSPMPPISSHPVVMHAHYEGQGTPLGCLFSPQPKSLRPVTLLVAQRGKVQPMASLDD